MITNYKKQVTAAKLKQAYSIVKQAYSRAEAEYGSIDGWEEFNIPPGGADAATTKAAIEKYIVPYIDTIGLREMPYKLSPNQLGNKYYPALTNPTQIRLKNGMSLVVNSIYNDSNRFVWCMVFIYLNGENGSHELGKDVFVMAYYKRLRPTGMSTEYIRKNVSGVYLIGEGNTTEQLKTLHMYACEYATADGPLYGAACGALIMQNSWKIPDDYHW